MQINRWWNFKMHFLTVNLCTGSNGLLNLFSPHLILYDTKHFCSILANLSNLSHSRWPFLFHQKFPLMFTRKYVLESLFNKVTGLVACNFIRKKSQHRFFSSNITKCLRKVFLWNTSKHYKIMATFCIKICMIQFLKDQMSSIPSDLYEEILKLNKSHANCIIQIIPCKTALIQL